MTAPVRADLEALAVLHGPAPKLAKPLTFAQVVHIRRSGDAVLVSYRRPDGVVALLRVTKADEPGLEQLADTDRSRVRGALLSLHRDAARTLAG